MNISKSMVLLLGRHRSFDIAGKSHAAETLREHGLTAVHDVTNGDAQLPEKWHGLRLGGEDSTVAAWKAAAAAAEKRADDMQNSAIPTASRGRRAQATGTLMGKANATLKFTAPHKQKEIDGVLGRVQTAVNRLVLGPQPPLKANEARQAPRDFGIGMLDVRAHMSATWLKPLLSTAGARHDQRPYEHYYAQAARLAYPHMDAGRELLTLNLGFHAVLAMSAASLTGEVRQAFRALAQLPPFGYTEPEDDSAAIPRAEWTREQIDDLILFLNPATAAKRPKQRATKEKEAQVAHWARQGIRRVRDVLTDDGKRLLTLDELLAKHPGLRSHAHPQAEARIAYDKYTKDLMTLWGNRLKEKRPTKVKRGEVRWSDGTYLRATQSSTKRSDTQVPAEVLRAEPYTGRLAPTGDMATLPADRADSILCRVIDTQGAPTAPRGKPEQTRRELDEKFSLQLLAPPGQPAGPDTRTVTWRVPATAQDPRLVRIHGVEARGVRLTFTAQSWVDPRVFEPGGRYEELVEGLTEDEARAKIRDIAAGITHWAIPPEEQVHLLKVAHHGYYQGAVKCTGAHALCARCLQNRRAKEENATHEYHECPAAAEVWKQIADAWEIATGERLDIGDPSLTIMGLRTRPASWVGEAGQRWKQLEPAWRLLHAATLLQIHRARCRVHAAFHSKARTQPGGAEAHHVIRAVKKRVQQRIEYEHARARHAADHGHDSRTRAAFHAAWVLTGLAAMTKHGPRLALFQKQQPAEAALPSGALHVRTAGVHAKTRRADASGWAMEVTRVQPDGTEKVVLRASGAVPARSTHAKQAPAHAESRHTLQAARQAAVEAALAFATAALARARGAGGVAVAITVDNITTLRDLHCAQPHVQRQQEKATAAARIAARQAAGTKRARPTEDNTTKTAASGSKAKEWRPRAAENLRKLTKLKGNIMIRAPRAATSLHLVARAQEAAQRKNINATVITNTRTTEGPVWSGNRIWDPGD